MTGSICVTFAPKFSRRKAQRGKDAKGNLNFHIKSCLPLMIQGKTRCFPVTTWRTWRIFAPLREKIPAKLTPMVAGTGVPAATIWAYLSMARGQQHAVWCKSTRTPIPPAPPRRVFCGRMVLNLFLDAPLQVLYTNHIN